MSIVTQKVNELIRISENFIGVIKKENKALKDRDVDTMGKLLEQKNKLSSLYRDSVDDLKEAYKENNELIDEEIKENLKASYANLKQEIDMNMDSLRLEMEVQRRMVDAIAEAVREAYSLPGTYDSNGGKKDSSFSQTESSFSLDRNL